MPIEFIKQIQQQRAEEAARQEKARLEALEKEKLAREDAERIRVETAEKRRQFVIKQTEKIVNISGVFSSLQRIKKEMLEGNVKNHELSYLPDRARLALVWGTSFKIDNDGKVDSDHSCNYHYSYIEVKIDVDKEILTIQGQSTYKFDVGDIGKKDKVEMALAEAYLDPKRCDYIPSSSSEHEDNSGCCCCSAT